MKTFFTLLVILLMVSFSGYSQAPALFNYQGVARNSVGSVLANKTITLRLSIHDGLATGTVVYAETRTVLTNPFGLFNVQVGSPGASPITGSITGLNWALGNKFIQVEIDPAGGSSFINIGTAQLASVPYALNAMGASPIGSAGGSLTGNYPNPLIANGAVTQPMIAAGVTLPPSGAAGGSLTGNYPNPLIASGAVTQPMIAAGVTLPPSGAAGGSLTGTYPNPLIANGAVTQPMIAAGVTLPPGGAAGGDLTGTYPNPVLVNTGVTPGTYGNASNYPSVTVDAKGRVIAAAQLSFPASLSPTGAAGGDLSGTYPNPTVSKLQTIPINPAAPTINQLLQYNGTDWKAATITGLLPAGTNKQTLRHDGSNWVANSALQNDGTNIGIGTSNALNKLHVAGGLRVDTLTGVNGNGLVTHDADGVIYGLKFSGNITDVLRGDGTFGSGGAGSVGWLLNGNSGTNPANNFIGTTDDASLVFRIRNHFSGIIDSAKLNTAFGYRAGSLEMTGTHNTSFGFKSLFANTTGNKNVSFGDSALFNNNEGFENTALGSRSMIANTTGQQNAATGFKALAFNTIGNWNTANGSYALSKNTEGTYNTATVHRAMNENTTGNWNTATGFYALLENTEGIFNTATGSEAMRKNTIGSHNTAQGYQALYSNREGIKNVGSGSLALAFNATGNENVATGYAALYSNGTGSWNTAAGAFSLQSNIWGVSNTATGSYALLNNYDGIVNTACGHRCMENNSSGSYNVASGYHALQNNISGNGNVGIGYAAGATNTSGSNLTIIGNQANVAVNGLDNATAIGFTASVNQSNKVRIGNAAVTVIEGQVPYTWPSDGRFKANVADDIKGLAFILKLRPVSYNFQTKKYDAFINSDAKFTASIDFTESEKLRHNGFIAQEVEEAAKQTNYQFDGIVAPKNNKDTYGLSYSQFVVPLVKAVQEQQAIIEKQQKQIDAFLKRIEALEKK